jgi:hypothetical protein
MACTRGLDRPILVVALVFYSPRVMPGVLLLRRSAPRCLITVYCQKDRVTNVPRFSHVLPTHPEYRLDNPLLPIHHIFD